MTKAYFIRNPEPNDATFGARSKRLLGSKHRIPALDRFLATKKTMRLRYALQGRLMDGSEPTKAQHNPWSPWFDREGNAPLHPAVRDALKMTQPVSLRVLLFNWPHMADKSPAMLAYTRNAAHGEADRQTVVAPGKYLRRMFPLLRDDEIRDIVGSTAVGEHLFGFATTKEDMIEVVTHGPQSCMAYSVEDFDDNTNGHHPYEVYDPALGWSLAYQRNPDPSGDPKYVARALVHANTFVRSFALSSDESNYSYSAHGLEGWLAKQGISKRSSWTSGTPLRRIDLGDDIILAAYIDGSCDSVYTTDDYKVLALGTGDTRIGSMDTDSGSIEIEPERCTIMCDICAEDYDEDHEFIWVGRDGDSRCCTYCADSYYYVRGRRQEEYHVHQDNAVEADDGSGWYDEKYLADNDVVRTEDDCVALEHNCWCCAHTGDWYYSTDERVVLTIGSGHYVDLHEDNVDAYLDAHIEHVLVAHAECTDIALHIVQRFVDKVLAGNIVPDDEDDFADLCTSYNIDNPLARVNADADPIEE